MGLIYLDTCLCIYAVEQASRFHEQTLEAIAGQPTARFAVSHLVIAECLVGPLKSGNALVAQDYEDFFSRTTILDLGEIVFRQAAFIKASSKLKMPDALHLACAQFHGCEALWTNDDRLSQTHGAFVRRVIG